MVRQILRLSMRHFKLEEFTDFDYRDMFYYRTGTHFTHLGECVYTLNTTNFKWPKDVSYSEMRKARSDVIWGMAK